MFLSIKNEAINVTERDRVQDKSEKWRESEQLLSSLNFDQFMMTGLINCTKNES
jgi:hypothetical protein